MKAQNAMPFRIVLPLPAFVWRPITAAFLAAVHVYLAAGHLSRLFGGEVGWTNIWKGFGALAWNDHRSSFIFSIWRTVAFGARDCAIMRNRFKLGSPLKAEHPAFVL